MKKRFEHPISSVMLVYENTLIPVFGSVVEEVVAIGEHGASNDGLFIDSGQVISAVIGALQEEFECT